VDQDIITLLEDFHDRYNTPAFVADDPISIPRRFYESGAGDSGMAVQPRIKDIEIAGFLAATIAWGNRKAILKSAGRMIELMDDAPHDFVMNASAGELDRVAGFVHRTFSGGDLRDFLLAIRRIYSEFGSFGDFFEGEYLRSAAESGTGVGDLRRVIARFRTEFFASAHATRCEKHLASIERGAACKRVNMFLRWMVRHDDRGVDMGIWRAIPPSALYLPLDVHSAATARSLRLLHRRQNDWRAVEEVTARLREFDPADPARFDFALFGAGIDGVKIDGGGGMGGLK
jgi:uncharacterized protein (TIGR02757 family)